MSATPHNKRVIQVTPEERRVAEMVGGSVRRMREDRRISRVTVGVWLGQSEDAIGKAERGERRFSIADIVRLSLEFGCTTDDLIFGKRERPRLVRHATMVFPGN